MLNNIQIKNFKCFADTGKIDFRPITLFVGPNSSGKSTIIQALLLLRQTIESPDINIQLATSDGWVQMGAYPEFIYKNQPGRNLEITFETSASLVPITSKLKGSESYYKKFIVRAQFCYNRKTTQIMLKESEVIFNEQRSDKLYRSSQRGRYSLVQTYYEKDVKKEKIYKKVVPVKFYGFRHFFRARQEDSPLEDYVFSRISIERAFRNLFYLGPLREFPKRIYVTSGQAPQDVGIKGERAVDILWLSHWSKTRRIRNIENQTRIWMKTFGLVEDIKLQRVSQGNFFVLRIVDKSTGALTNLADIGFGASQTLPIIIESLFAPRESMVLIEQPEIHLHPRAQATLGDLFIEAVKDTKRVFLIETHSEHLIDRIRRRIAEKVISKDMVAIYYFKPGSEGTKIEKITLDDDGQLASFPEGFFEEGLTEAFEHLKAIKSNSQQ
jgi:AAA15 family ATPase/GTPase